MSLSLDQVRFLAPSVFAEQPWHEVSAKYTFIPTSEVVEALVDNGFVVTHAAQSVTRVEGKEPFTKHQLRFRRPQDNIGGEGAPEVLLTNDHAGGGAFKLQAGFFRFACFNGLIVGTSFGDYRVRHSGRAGDVVEAAFEVVNEFPRVIETAREWQSLQLNEPEQLVLANAALDLRYPAATRTTPHGAIAPPPITAEQALLANRGSDRSNTLWHAFNRLQENLTQGGLRGRAASGRRIRTRAVTGINENTSLNRALWTLTDAFAKLKAGEAEGVRALLEAREEVAA